MTAASESERQPVGTMWLLDLASGAPGTVTPRIPAVFQQAGPEAAAPLAEAIGFAEPAPVLERLAGERRCYVALVGGAIAAYGWVSFKEEWISELALHIQLSPGDAYIWDCATLPAYRGQGLYPALLAHIVGELQAEGVRRVWIGTDTGSVDSQKGIVRAGFLPVADFYFAPAGAAERFYVRGRPGADERLVRDAHDALLNEDKPNG